MVHSVQEARGRMAALGLFKKIQVFIDTSKGRDRIFINFVEAKSIFTIIFA